MFKVKIILQICSNEKAKMSTIQNIALPASPASPKVLTEPYGTEKAGPPGAPKKENGAKRKRDIEHPSPNEWSTLTNIFYEKDPGLAHVLVPYSKKNVDSFRRELFPPEE